jgi:hypothetical protein
MEVREVLLIEKDFILSMYSFYEDYENISHLNRTIKYYNFLRNMYFKHSIYKDCIECGALYSLIILGKQHLIEKNNTIDRFKEEKRGKFIKN